MSCRRLGIVAALAVGLLAPGTLAGTPTVFRIDRVTDGDTVVLRNGRRVRLVQIDTPEVYFGIECYGRAASATTKRLLPPGTRVTLRVEPATDRVDDYGRLLRYVVRADGVNVNFASSRSARRPRTSTRAVADATQPASRRSRGAPSGETSDCGRRAHERSTHRTAV